MSIIEKIRRRVEKADQQLGAGAAQNRDYAQRLTKLLDRLEIEHEGRKVRTESVCTWRTMNSAPCCCRCC